MKLIENIEQVHRLWSVRLAAVGAALSTAWGTMSKAEQESFVAALGLPPSVLVVVGFLAVICVRIVAQPSLSQPSVKKGGGTGGDEPGP